MLDARAGARWAAADLVHVLFVGNSYTFYGDVPGQVAGLAAGDPGAPAVTPERVVQGGASLRAHYHAPAALARLAEAGATHVVLQDKASQPLHDRADHLRYVGWLAAAARDAGARVYLFETWARAAEHAAYEAPWSGGGPRAWARRVRRASAEAARRAGATVIEVGTVWERALAAHPRLALHAADGHHASPLGSHLAAACVYVALTGRDPRASRYRAEGVHPDRARLARALAFGPR